MAPFFSSPTITTSSTKSPRASGTSKAAKSKTSRAPTKNISPTPRKKPRNLAHHVFHDVYDHIRAAVVDHYVRANDAADVTRLQRRQASLQLRGARLNSLLQSRRQRAVPF